MHERKSALESRLADVATQIGRRHVPCTARASPGTSSTWAPKRAASSSMPPGSRPMRPTSSVRSATRSGGSPHDVRGTGYECVLANAECPQRIREDVLAVHKLAHDRNGGPLDLRPADANWP